MIQFFPGGGGAAIVGARGQSNRSGYKVRSHRSSPAVLLVGGCKEEARGFFRRFTSSGLGIYFLHISYRHTHRRWGSIDSRGTAVDQIRRKEGGRTGSQCSKRGSRSMGTSYPAQKMRCFKYHPRPAISRANPVPSH